MRTKILPIVLLNLVFLSFKSLAQIDDRNSIVFKRKIFVSAEVFKVNYDSATYGYSQSNLLLKSGYFFSKNLAGIININLIKFKDLKTGNKICYVVGPMLGYNLYSKKVKLTFVFGYGKTNTNFEAPIRKTILGSIITYGINGGYLLYKNIFLSATFEINNIPSKKYQKDGFNMGYIGLLYILT